MKRKKLKIVLSAALCVGVIAASIVSANQEAKMTAKIPEHDGEVLVDSLNVQQEKSDEAADTKEETSAKDTELVTSDDVSEMKNSDSYFQEMRATINLDRNEMISMLTDAEATAENSGEKESANEQKMELLENMQMEQEVENAIAAKGLPECLVLITENGVNVTVNKQELTENDVAKICDIVMRETGRNASQIIIQSKF